jgi:arylesterase/paraoxonase
MFVLCVVAKCDRVNSVLATGLDSFYFSNYEYFRSHLGTVLEIFLKLKWTDIVYFNGSDYTSVAGDMRSPNGLAMSDDGQ